MIDPILDHLEREEEFRGFVYDDATGLPIRPGTIVKGHPTAGYGCALDVEPLTKEEARYLLRNRYEARKAALDAALPWWRALSPARQLVLVSMAYQLGIAGLLKFHDTLAAVKRGDWEAAAAGMRASLWARQTPARAERLAEKMRNGS